MARVQSTSRKSEDAKDVQLQALLLTAKGSSDAKQYAMDFLKDNYPEAYLKNFSDHLPQVMESDDEDLSEPEEMSEDDDDEEDCFVLPASGIVATPPPQFQPQPPPPLHRQRCLHPLLMNKCRRCLFY